MPYYRYVATDATGQRQEGSLLSPSLRDASADLRLRGLRVAQITEGAPPPASTPLGIPPAMPTVVAAAPARGQATSPVTRLQASRPPPAARDAVHTKRYKNSDLLILFSQLASYFKSGISPQQAFGDLQGRSRRRDYQESLGHVQVQTTAGMAISDALERYPDLYPPHVPGLIRAGEAGGFLPEAATFVSQQAEAAWKWEKPFRWMKFLFVLMILVVPISVVFRVAILEVWSAQDGAGGNLPALPLLGSKIWQAINFPVGPLILGSALLALWLFDRWWNSRGRTLYRHQLALRAPVFGKRATAESTAVFSWTLSNLSRAGVSPHRAWLLAMDAVPNLAYRDKLRLVATKMGEKTHLSSAILETGLLPYDYAMIVQTGETTGDVPGALMDAARMSQAEFESMEEENEKVKKTLGCTMSAIGFLLLAYFFYQAFYLGLIDKATQ